MTDLVNKCEPAASILAILGVRNVARKLKITPGAVSQWAKQGWGDGRIPFVHREAIAQLLNAAGAPQIATELLKMSGGASPRKKGDRYEREIVNAMVDVPGCIVRRVPLSGAVIGFPGDIEINVAGVKLLGQCKISADGNGYTRIVRNMTAAVTRFVDFDGMQLIGMRFHLFQSMFSHHSFVVPDSDNKSLKGGKFKVARDALKDHHILFFRRNKEQTHVLMPLNVYDFLIKIRH